ncbi:MAG: tripartite tricarboxylate transporter substrate binding protein, partial [Betaproteobacteria bacterium]|nr:tripartite tricarboxylate transporter substrate binding protein [Betaproteobacteria bacterium]
AQNYPTRPVRIVTSEPGSTNDLVARLIAQGLTVSLGRQVIVDNRAIRAGEVVAGAQPDGYTLLSYGTPLWIMPFLRDNVPWDPVRDFSPVTWATSSPNILVVHPSVRVNSVSELIGMAKARPGELNYATSSPGSAAHLAGELFRVMAAVKIVRIAYKGTGTALNGIVGGEVQLMFSTAAAAAPHIKSGRLRALAVTSAQPTSLVPGLPTVAASGLPGYEAILILGIFAPAGTPAALLTRLNEEVVRTLNTAEVKERLHKVGVEVVGSSPAQFAAKIRSEMARWSKVIKDAGIRDE